MVIRRIAPTLALLLSFLATADQAEAQVVEGRLLESGTEAPVPLGRVMLLDTAYVVVEETFTDHSGHFTLRAPRPGDYWIGAERLGYHPVLDGIVELGDGGFLPVALYIRSRPVELEGVTATVRRRRTRVRLTNAGFYERARDGFGTIITPEEIEERPPADHRDLLRRVPAIRFSAQGPNGDVVYFRARGPGGRDSMPPGYCRPRIYVDGVHMGTGPRAGGFEVPIDELVDVDDVIAVEVYRGGATIPLQWGGAQGHCGVILFWTEAGG